MTPEPTEPARPASIATGAAPARVPEGNVALVSPPVPDVPDVPGAADAWEGKLSSRIGWFVLAAIPLAVISTARMLTPNPIGHGTHTQLGLPPCGFLVITGCPCPGCGLTTAFSYMSRLDIFGAAHANPFGIPLFLVTAFTIPVAIRGFVRGDSVVDTLDAHHAEKVAGMLAVCGVVVWTIRAAMHFFG